MKMACIGVAKIEGTFNNIPYDNYELYFTDIEDSRRLAGVIPLTKNVRVSEKRNVKSLVAWKVKAADWKYPVQPVDFNGKICQILYDSYGNIAEVKLEG